MPAEVESMMWADHGNVGDRPWHGLGVKVDGCVTSEEAIKKSGLDWEVEKRQIFCPGSSDMEFQVVPDAFAVVRKTDHKPLGVVGARYVPLQNRVAFSFFDDTGRHEGGDLRNSWVVEGWKDHLDYGENARVDGLG